MFIGCTILSLMNNTDNNLFEQIRNNNEDAFHKVFNIYCDRLFVFAKMMTADPAVAKDIVQEFFIRYWEKRHYLEFNALSFKTYAFRAVFNASMNHIRDTKKVVGEYEINLDLVDVNDADAETLGELTAILNKAIDQLPQRCKDIFVAAKIQKKSYSEIANQYGISENTVKVQVSKAYRLLRKKVS